MIINNPKITVINLDGYDHPANLEIVNKHLKNVQYISVFDDDILIGSESYGNVIDYLLE